MDKLQLNSKNKRALTYGVIIALVVGYLLLKPFIGILIIAAIAAYIFFPVFSFLHRKLHKAGLSASLTLIVTLLAVIIPATLVVLITLAQLKTFSNDVARLTANVDFSNLQKETIDKVNQFTGRLPFEIKGLEPSQVANAVKNILGNISSFLIDQLSATAGSISRSITNIILFVYVFLSILLHHKALVRTFKKLNPLGDDVSDLYLQQAGAMTQAMVRGQFIIAACQGVASALILAAAGIDYIAFFALILTVLSIIPLGAGIVTIPIGIILILTGNIWQGLLVILGHLLITTNIDNVLRPHLVPKNAQLDPALTILGVFAGVAAFGLLGVVIGPVIMILVVTTIKIYSESTQ